MNPEPGHKHKDSKHDSSADQTPESGIVSKEEFEKMRVRLEELEGVRERLLLSAADFENAKKRLARERDEFVRYGQENLIREMLPVLDNFERALSHAPAGEGNMKGVISGIQMVYKQLSEILKTQGVKRIQSVGEVFDPHRHEAVGFVKGEKENQIVEEIEPGYFLHDRLLRAAKVRVASLSGGHGAGPEDEKQEELT